MRSILVVGLIILNVALATAIFAPAAQTPGTELWKSCCRGAGPQTYCCQNCCFLGAGCEDCVRN